MGGGRVVGGGSGGVPVVLVAEDVSKLETALDVVDKNGYVNTREVSRFPSRNLLEAGRSAATAVVVQVGLSLPVFFLGKGRDNGGLSRERTH